jgi:hypothetical protein
MLFKILSEQIELILKEEGLFDNSSSDNINLTSANNSSQDQNQPTSENDENSSNIENDDSLNVGEEEKDSSDITDINENDPNKTPEDNVFDYIKKVGEEKNNNAIELVKAAKTKMQTDKQYNNPTVAQKVIEKMRAEKMDDAANRLQLYLIAQGI